MCCCVPDDIISKALYDFFFFLVQFLVVALQLQLIYEVN